MSFRLSLDAQRDLAGIWVYISAGSPGAADRFMADLEEHFDLLGSYKLAGPARPELAPQMRFFPLGNYLIFYLPTDDGIEVARVLHGARNYGARDF